VLEDFGGVPVTSMSIAVRNAGDGLSDSLSITPNPHNTGDEFYLVLHVVCGPIDHEPVDDAGKKVKGADLVDGFAAYRRIEDAMTLDAIEVPEVNVKQWLDDERARITAIRAERGAAVAAEQEAARLEAERLAGIEPLFGDGSFDPDNLPPEDDEDE
jgi:hypothetical protein